MDIINDRLKLVVNEIGYTVLNDLDRTLGVARNTTSNYVGLRKAKPGPEYLEKLFKKFPQINTRWVMTGEGEPFTPETLNKEYIENLERQLEIEKRRAARYEKMIDMATQANDINFQPLSEGTHVREIYPLYSNLLKKTA